MEASPWQNSWIWFKPHISLQRHRYQVTKSTCSVTSWTSCYTMWIVICNECRPSRVPLAPFWKTDVISYMRLSFLWSILLSESILLLIDCGLVCNFASLSAKLSTFLTEMFKDICNIFVLFPKSLILSIHLRMSP